MGIAVVFRLEAIQGGFRFSPVHPQHFLCVAHRYYYCFALFHPNKYLAQFLCFQKHFVDGMTAGAVKG